MADDIVSIVPGLSPAEQKYAEIAKSYADKGNKLGSTVAGVKSFIAKAAIVGADAASASGMGAAIGAAIGGGVFSVPAAVVGAWVGGIAGGVYGAFDQFGGDIEGVINPPDFKESDYDRMRRAAINSGALPVPGVPPDQYGGCIYPNGMVSGGDTPFPGKWNGEQRDPVQLTANPFTIEYAADVAAQKAQLGNLGSYIQGLKALDAIVDQANAAMHNPGALATDRTKWIDKIERAFAILYVNTGQDKFAPLDLGRWRADVEKRIAQPAPPSPAMIKAMTRSIAAISPHVLAAHLTVKIDPHLLKVRTLLNPAPVSGALPPTPASLLTTAHNALQSLGTDASGAPAIRAGIGNVVGAAESTSATSAAIHAAVLDQAQKIQVRNAFVQYWLFGPGAVRAGHAA
jgi:hypothetical protein